MTQHSAYDHIATIHRFADEVVIRLLYQAISEGERSRTTPLDE